MVLKTCIIIHHLIACRGLVLMACSLPINSPKGSRRVVLVFDPHTVDISQHTAAVCPIAEHAVSIYLRNFEFSLQLG